MINKEMIGIILIICGVVHIICGLLKIEYKRKIEKEENK